VRAATSWMAIAIAWSSCVSALAQDLENGQRISERWCASCHATGTRITTKTGAISFAAIAAKPGMTSQLIVSFLTLPHATMPSFPLKQSDAQDVSAYILKMKQ